jgi:hypothetical protein
MRRLSEARRGIRRAKEGSRLCPRRRLQVTRLAKLRGRAGRAGVRRPKHSQRASHRCEPHDGREWRRQGCSRRKRRPRHGRPAARRCAARSRRKTPSRRPGSPAAPATRVAGKRCREHQEEDPGRSAAPRRARRPAPPRLRSRSRGAGWPLPQWPVLALWMSASISRRAGSSSWTGAGAATSSR